MVGLPPQCPFSARLRFRRLSDGFPKRLRCSSLRWRRLACRWSRNLPPPCSLATVDGVAISDDDVDRVVGSVVWPLEDRLYQIRKQAVEALIKQRLLEREAARGAGFHCSR